MPNPSPRYFLTLLSFSLILAACEVPEDDASDVIDMDGLALSVDRAVEQLDEDADTERGVQDPMDPESSDVLMELSIEPQSDGALVTREDRRERVRILIRQAAEDETCALRGVIAGRYVEDDEGATAEPSGAFSGRAFRRQRRLVAQGEGRWSDAAERPGGSFDGEYVNFEGAEGVLEGDYAPGAPEAAVPEARLGTFAGSWDPTDPTIDGGNIGGLWHPTEDGRGVFIGYWSRCDLEPRHEREPAPAS